MTSTPSWPDRPTDADFREQHALPLAERMESAAEQLDQRAQDHAAAGSTDHAGYAAQEAQYAREWAQQVRDGDNVAYAHAQWSRREHELGLTPDHSIAHDVDTY